MLDTAPPRDACRTLLAAAAAVAGTGDPGPILPASKCNAGQILAVPTLLPEVARAGATA